jgi:hypothetical protein
MNWKFCKQYQILIWNRFVALENLSDGVDELGLGKKLKEYQNLS